MLTSEGELRAWNRLSVQEKAAMITVVYISAAMFPWIVMTAGFAFFIGRSYGFEIGKLNVKLEQEKTEAIRSKLVAEMEKHRPRRVSLHPGSGSIRAMMCMRHLEMGRGEIRDMGEEKGEKGEKGGERGEQAQEEIGGGGK